MKCSAILCSFLLFACACNSNNAQRRLLSEQKILKDSANDMNERIGDYLYKGDSAKAEAEKVQLTAVHTRLIAIQFSLDSLTKGK